VCVCVCVCVRVRVCPFVCAVIPLDSPLASGAGFRGVVDNPAPRIISVPFAPSNAKGAPVTPSATPATPAAAAGPSAKGGAPEAAAPAPSPARQPSKVR
jgi:hypothetical protein